MSGSFASALWVIASLLTGTPFAAQMPPAADTAGTLAVEPSIFAPFTLPPAPSATRLVTGAPGPKYWQNRADYNFRVRLDTATHIVYASMTLRYTNHSPDTLKVLWFQVGALQIDSIAQVAGGTTVPLVLRDNERTTPIKLAQDNETHITVPYANKGQAVLPVLVRFTFSDSTTREVTYPAGVWKDHPTAYTVAYTFPKKMVRRIAVDPDNHLPDADRANNVWTAK